MAPLCGEDEGVLDGRAQGDDAIIIELHLRQMCCHRDGKLTWRRCGSGSSAAPQGGSQPEDKIHRGVPLQDPPRGATTYVAPASAAARRAHARAHAMCMHVARTP